jgi:protocatechuate 3,4-dioxygenase beta subunit
MNKSMNDRPQANEISKTETANRLVIASEVLTKEKSGRGILHKRIEKMDVKHKNIHAHAAKEFANGILSLFVYDTETGEPIPDVTVSIPVLNHFNITDEEGEAYADDITPGKYLGTLLYDDYEPLNFSFSIKAGKTSTLLLYMDRETV